MPPSKSVTLFDPHTDKLMFALGFVAGAAYVSYLAAIVLFISTRH